ncbi:uncharacterized protein GO595_006772 [Histomonas meleagridis]|uniref:uncharacterized protein n=1 Tax=Histomonas meleagridis TaxID=135588 RepID=UPI0035597464|nr:hypothetical protein GO595_006772 [Histomonas meleagridis]
MFKKKKIKVILTDMKLIDMPPNQYRIFFKAKQGSKHIKTKAYAIVQNQVIFPEPICFLYDVSSHFSGKLVRPLRLSFRFETATGSGYTRYGIVEIDVVQCFKENKKYLHVLLDHCSYNTCFSCLLLFPDESPPAEESSESQQFQSLVVPRSESETSFSARSGSFSNQKQSETFSISDSNSSVKGATFSVTNEKYQLLEKQIDQLLTDVILKFS